MKKKVTKITLYRGDVVAMVTNATTDYIFNLGRVIRRITGLREEEVKTVLTASLFNVAGKVSNGKL